MSLQTVLTAGCPPPLPREQMLRVAEVLESRLSELEREDPTAAESYRREIERIRTECRQVGPA